MSPHLNSWATQHGHPVPTTWRRVYGRFRPGRSPWAMLAYAAPDGRPTVRVDLLDWRDVRREPGVIRDDHLGQLMITDSRDDPTLPGLGTVLDALEHSVAVRYRPGHRCTVRGGSGRETRYVKVAADTPDTHVDARALWVASRAGEFSFAVAEPCGWDEKTRSSWYAVVPGQPIAASMLGTDGAIMARRIGAALAELSITRLEPQREEGPADQLDRTGRAVRRAATAAPELADHLDSALDVLSRAHHALSDRALVPVHGSPHMHQWLEDDAGRLGLVDFDRYALAEPELDLATLFVELESESERLVPSSELERAVVDGFESVGGSLDEDRLQLYAVHKRLAKVARTAFGLRADGDTRARRHLDALTEDLALLDRSASRQTV
jgi:aminoglycoside phosphotransferase (APT) family kinase protein